MILETFNKQPIEVADYDLTYADWLAAGDNLALTTTTVAPTGTTGDLTVDSISTYDPVVKFWISGGRSGVTYKVTVTTRTTSLRVRQDEFKVRVKEI